MSFRSAPEFLSGALHLFALCLALLGLGCGLKERAPDLRIVNGKEPESLDPATVVGQADGRAVMSLFEGLTRYNAVTADPEPALAERWDISANGLVYTFHLRPNLTWSTGEAITAEDFVYSWFRVLEPATASDYVGNLFYIKNAEDYHLGKIKDRSQVGIKAPDPKTLRVELVNPTAFFLDLCAFPTQAIVHRATIEKHGDRWLNARPLPVSGSYELLDWKLNDRIRLRKNERYWDAAQTSCTIVDLLPVTAPTTALNLFLTGQADIVWDKDVVPLQLLDVLRQRPDFHCFDFLGTFFFRYNVTRKPLHDVRVRKALTLVIDRSRIVDKILHGGGKAARAIVPAGIRGYAPAEGLGFDPEQARSLLAAAGFPGGRGFPRFSYLFTSGTDQEGIAVEMQDMWKRELGIEIDLRAVEWKVWLSAESALDYDLCRGGWIGDYTDPNTFLDMFMSNNPNNQTGWKNERYDALMRQANATPEAITRLELLRQAETILVRDDVPIVPLYTYAGFNFFNTNRIAGIYNNLRDEHPVRAIRLLESKFGGTISASP